MTAIVSVETVLLVLLIVLVAGLLRSNAEILRRLGPSPGGPDGSPPSAPRGRERNARVGPAPSISGVTPVGDAVSLSFDGDTAAPTLLAFLTSGCGTCGAFWGTLGEEALPAGIQTLIVAHGAEREQPARLRQLAPREVPVVMSSQAWEEYEVPGSPYFVLVDGGIRGEGVATTWNALSSLVRDAIEDERTNAASGALSIDEALAAGGIGPDHPSLYPAGKEAE